MTTKSRIEEKLAKALAPMAIEVLNESHGHNVPKGSETHFKVVVVSSAFVNQGLIARHRLVYQALAEELQAGVHALALHTYTPEEWAERSAEAPESPRCHGGGAKR